MEVCWKIDKEGEGEKERNGVKKQHVFLLAGLSLNKKVICT